MVKPSQRRRKRTKEAILEAALSLINQGGVEALSMRELADRIDYSAAALYEYFDSKDAIIQAICERGHDQLAAAMSRVDQSLPIREYMLGIGKAYIQFAVDYPDYFQLMFDQVVPITEGEGADMKVPPPSMLEEGSSFGILVAGIQRGIEEGVFRAREGFDWLEMAYSAWATVHGLAMLRTGAMRQFEFDFARTEEEVLKNFHRGLINED